MRVCEAVTVAALLVAAPAVSRGQTPPPTTAESAATDTSDVLRTESSLQTTGRLLPPPSIQKLGATLPPPPPPAPVPEAADDQERPVAAATLPEAPAPDDAKAVMSLDSNMGKRVNEMLACRMQVAGDRRVRVDEVLAGTLLLRGTVRPDGAVDSPEVVALRDTDPEVLSCVKRKLAGWLVVRPRGAAAVAFEYELKFPGAPAQTAAK